VAEHVARSFDEAAGMIEGQPHHFPKMPGFVRPVFRTLVFNRTVRSGRFPKARTFKAFDPAEGPPTPAAARDRLRAAHERFADACAACARGDGRMTSSVFGAVSVADYIRFVTLHTRHHRKQIPTG
jgi:hypothetical protein